jgi:TonB family protein
LGQEGEVKLEAVIIEDGSVGSVRPVVGNPVLMDAAADALKRWRFKPLTDGGRVVKAVAPISFIFKLCVLRESWA